MRGIIRSLSGIRGLVDGPMNSVEGYKTAAAFFERYISLQSLTDGEYLIVIGKDPKKSGEKILKGISAALQDISSEKGVDFRIVNLGSTGTPVVQWAVRFLDASAGIMVTASHNPIEWNGIKLLSSASEGGGALLPDTMREVSERLSEMDTKVDDKRAAIIKERCAVSDIPRVKQGIIPEYFKSVIIGVCSAVDTAVGEEGVGVKILKKIKEKGFKVGLDCCSAEASSFKKSFLRVIGI
ncbi:MAG: hypothetical protein ACLFQK_11535, partial [Fibrobacterota bacterium]